MCDAWCRSKGALRGQPELPPPEKISKIKREVLLAALSKLVNEYLCPRIKESALANLHFYEKPVVQPGDSKSPTQQSRFACPPPRSDHTSAQVGPRRFFIGRAICRRFDRLRPSVVPRRRSSRVRAVRLGRLLHRPDPDHGHFRSHLHLHQLRQRLDRHHRAEPQLGGDRRLRRRHHNLRGAQPRSHL